MSEVYAAPTGIIDIPHDRETLTGLSQSEKLTRINPLNFKGWNDLLLATPGHCFFHTSNWLRVLVESYGYHPYYFILLDGSRVKVLFPLVEVNSWLTGKRAISLPFSDYCEPIVDNKTDAAEILAQMVLLGRRLNWKFIEMRGDGLVPEGICPASVFYRHTLSLEPGETIIWSRLRGNFRRAIQKGEKMDVRVDIHHSPEAMDQYYRLHCVSRKRHGLPPQPPHFFHKIYQHIISQDLGFIALATQHGTTISGAVYFHFGSQILYKYAAMDLKYQHIPANYLLLWRTIQWACEKGFQEFCFGKSNAEQKGLILFKDGWRAEKRVLRYYKYHLRKETFVQTEQSSDGKGYLWFRALPLPILKKVGALLYRHVG